MKRRKFILTSGGALISLGILSTHHNKSALALSKDNLNFPSEVEYGYRDNFEMFDSLKININKLIIETLNIEFPEETDIQLDVSIDESSYKTADKDILSNINDKKSIIPKSGSVNIINEVDINIELIDYITEDELNIDGETTVKLKFILKNNKNNTNTEVTDSFKLLIFEITIIKNKLYRIVNSDEIPDANFTDGSGELQNNAWRIVSDAPKIEDSLV